MIEVVSGEIRIETQQYGLILSDTVRHTSIHVDSEEIRIDTHRYKSPHIDTYQHM